MMEIASSMGHQKPPMSPDKRNTQAQKLQAKFQSMTSGQQYMNPDGMQSKTLTKNLGKVKLNKLYENKSSSQNSPYKGKTNPQVQG